MAALHAGQCGHAAVGVEHLVLALIEYGRGPVEEAFFALGITPSAAWKQWESLTAGRVVTSTAQPPHSLQRTPGAGHALSLSLEEMRQLGHNYIGSEHILLAVLQQLDNAWAEPELAGEFFDRLGVDLGRLRQDLLSRIPTEGDPPSSDEGSAMTQLNQQEFYAWAYGDLFTNTTRGVLAEYIVATALGIHQTKRVAWNQYDLEFDGAEIDGVEIEGGGVDGGGVDGGGVDGAGIEGAGIEGAGIEGAGIDGGGVDRVGDNRVGIEVKSAAYMQAWEQDRPSEITFSIRRAQGWDERTNTRADSANRSAKVYVFCVLEGKDKASIDPLDVAQWTFYVLATSELNRQFPTQKTIRLGPLIKALGAGPCTYDELNDAIREAADKRLGSDTAG